MILSASLSHMKFCTGIDILLKDSDSRNTGEVCEPGGKTRETLCEPSRGGEMGGSPCIITVLLLMVVFLQTASWRALAAVMWKRTRVGNNSQLRFRGRGFQDHMGYTCFFGDEGR